MSTIAIELPEHLTKQLRQELVSDEAVSEAVTEAVEEWLETRRLKARSDRERAMDALERVGAAGLAGRPIGKLSGGETQRIYLARFLVADTYRAHGRRFQHVNNFVIFFFVHALFFSLKYFNQGIFQVANGFQGLLQFLYHALRLSEYALYFIRFKLAVLQGVPGNF